MILPNLLVTLALAATAPASVSAMQWEKRILIVCASDAEDPSLRDQRRIIDRWRSGAAERDLAVVEVVGDRVTGASDSARALRQRCGMPAAGFAVVLIGKDGGAKFRATKPVSAAILRETIDAMPMRRGDRR